jgi:hypothetical protein
LHCQVLEHKYTYAGGGDAGDEIQNGKKIFAATTGLRSNPFCHSAKDW